MIDSIETVQNGTWWFTVRLRLYTPIVNNFPRHMTKSSLTFSLSSFLRKKTNDR
jgi:hypothetical protein